MKYLRVPFIIFVAFVLCLLPGNSAFAALRNLGDVMTLIDKISTWFLTLVVAISVIIMVWGGFNFMMSGGESDKVKEGRDRIIWGAVGLAVALLAKSITALVDTLVR
jgi:hypothetical protein